MSWSWLPGGPLTEFRRGRRSLPLPSERVKIRSRHVGPCCPRGSALTDFRRRWRNPSASSGQVLPLPQARGGLAGCGSTRAHSTGSGQALRRTPGRLTMNGRGWGTEVGRRGLGAAWDVFSGTGQCVQFSGERVQFFAACVHFPAECVHFGGQCVQFSTAGVRSVQTSTRRNATADVASGSWGVVGDEGGGGAGRDRGWGMPAVMGMQSTQATHALLAVQAKLAGMSSRGCLGERGSLVRPECCLVLGPG